MTIREIIQKLEDEKKQLKEENKALVAENKDLKLSKSRLEKELLSLKRMLDVKEETTVDFNQETGEIKVNGEPKLIYPVDIIIPSEESDVPEPPKKKRSRKKVNSEE